MLARISPGAAQVRLHRGMPCLQRVEDATELLERVLYQARFRSHLISQAGQLDENREQIGLFAGLFRPLPPVFIESVEIGAKLAEQRFLGRLVQSLFLPRPSIARPPA